MRLRCAVPPGARLLVGVSGGRDSVALLQALVELSSLNRWRLVVAHFDHRLRPDSGDDAQFIVDLAEPWGLAVCTGAWEHPETAEEPARQARHAFLTQCAQQHACDVIALAHQLEDQIETVLMRLGRGTGPRGLVGIPWRRSGVVDFVRPLLDCRRAELTSYLQSAGQTWREDPSNQDPARLRNRVRHDLVPVLEDVFGADRLERWADSLDDLRLLWDFVHASAAGLLQSVRRRSPLDARGRMEVCDVDPLRQAPAAVCAAALQQWFEACGCVNLRRQHLRGAVDLIRNGQSGHRITLPGKRSVALEQRSVVLVVDPSQVHTPARVGPETSETLIGERANRPADSPVPSTPRLHVEITHRAPDRATLVGESTRIVAPDALPTQFVAWIDADAAAREPWTVRLPLRGDRVRLLGAPGSRTLARLLQDSRIPRRLRAAWPVVADADGILWVPGIGVAERVRVQPGTQRAARLTLRTTALHGDGRVAAASETSTPPRDWGG